VLEQSSLFSRLRGLLEVTRLVRTGSELPDVLSAIARTVADSLGFRTVAITLRRREWDDFVVTTVHGRAAAREALLGQVRQPGDWQPLLDRRFLQRGAYFVPHDQRDWTDRPGFTPDLRVSDDPSAWHPDDALFVPMRAADGTLLGILSVDEPVSGRKPTGDEIEVLVAVAEHAALAVQAAQEATQAQRHREALECLLEVSTRLTGTWETEDLLQLVCESIADALRFEKVSLLLLEPADGTYARGASVGFGPGEDTGAPLAVDELDRLLAARFEVEGCYLIPHDDARRLLPARLAGYRSQRDGRGLDAWANHRLFVPLHDSRGLRIGYIWADDPLDRLLPTPQRLQLLRTFANQATTALAAAAQHQATRDSDERHRALIEASPVAIVDFDRDGVVRRWNAAAEETFGWRAEEAVGRFNPTVAPEDRGCFLSTLELVWSGEPIASLRRTRLRRDGSTVEVEVSARPIRGAQGDVVGVVSALADVGERARWENAVRASEARKDAILRSALDCVVTVDADGVIVEFNPAAEEILGWTHADAVGRALTRIAVAAEHRDAVEETLRTGSGPLLGTRCEIAALRADARPFPAEIAINRVDVPGPALYAVSLRDVTKRKDREERLREAEAKYRTLVEQIPLATYINEIGLPVHTHYMSPQIEEMLGYPVSSWLEPGFLWRCVHPLDRDRVAVEVERTHAIGERFRAEYRLVAADGRVVWVLDESVAVRDEEYRPLFLQGFLLDLTDRRPAERQLTAVAASA
jgi:PAS domain S-box-containing protein